MRNKKFLFLSIAALAGLGLVARAFARPPAAPAKPAPGRSPYAEIDAYIQHQMQRLNIPGASLAIVEGDRVTHLRGFGRDRPGGTAPSPQTPFVLGSTTKSFTALAVMQLVEAGKAALDDPVQRYLPWFRVADPAASAQITVRHLLNQTSGLSTISGWTPLADFDDRTDATERQARMLSTLKLAHPPGSAYEYSNANYNLLGLVIEAASGETYADYLQNHILNPLEMRHTYTSQAEAKQNGLAIGHRYWFWRPTAAPNLPLPRGSLPSGQLISSAEDMAQYLIAHLNGGRCGNARILTEAGITELHRGAAEVAEMGVSAGKYAMGWFDTGAGQSETIWHTGNVPDFSSYLAILPGQKKGLVLLTNTGHFMMTPVMAEIGAGAAALLAGQDPAPGPIGFSLATAAPWVMRALLLIPLLQTLGAFFILRRLRGWSADPRRRPSPGRAWGLHILLPLVPNLAIAAVPVYLWASKLSGFLRLFAPDFTLIARFCGVFAGVWAFLRTGLVLRSIRPGELN